MRNLFTKWSASFAILLGLSATSAFAQLDAGVQVILTPSTTVCRGTESVVVIIQNLGVVALDSVNVHWQVNGVAQAPATYNGLLNSTEQDTVDLGTFNFDNGPFTIEAWTDAPNGGTDADNTNDSANAVVNISTQMSGTYTIGGPTPDFADFPAAITALTTNGICNAVVFNMRPQTDSFQVVIPEITGADSTNTITFQSENGDSTSVILYYPSLDTTLNNYLIKLNGADYLIFKQITLERTELELNARVMEFTNNSTHNTITNCRLISVTGITTNSFTALIYSSAGSTFNDSSNTFTNNYFRDGSIGIYMNGINTASLENDIVITNNTFDNQRSKGVQMSNVGFAIIENNVFTTTSNYTGYAGVYLDRSNRPHRIVKNQVLGTPGTGMYLVDCTAQSGVHGIIANNFIWSNDSAGISMVNGDYQDIVYNSILMTGTTASFSALSLQGAGVGKIIKNNILANFGGGYAYEITDTGGTTLSDYNDLYTSGTNTGLLLGSPVTTLNNWIAATNMDSNSVAVNPNFVSNTDLHSTSVAMSDAGKSYSGILDDIDGDVRSATTPDIGADEYSAAARDVSITAILNPVDSTCGQTGTIVSVVVSNTGQANEQGFNVVTNITGALTQNLSQNHTAVLAPGASDTISYTLNPLNLSTGGTFNFKAYTSLNQDDVHANDTLELAIHLFTPPAAPTVTGTSICGTGSDTLFASSADTLMWYADSVGGVSLATGPEFVTPVVNATTTFYVSAKGACEGDRSPVIITVMPVPNVNLGNDTSILQGNSVTLDAGAGAVSYLWSTGATTQTIVVSADDCPWVEFTNGFGCVGTDTICVDVIFPSDIALSLNITPTDSDCASDSIPVEVRVSNVGTMNATNVPVTVNITGTVTITYMDTIPTLNAGSNVVLTMGVINVQAGGTITLQSYASYSGDLDHNNDTLVNVVDFFVQPGIPAGISSSRCGAGPLTLNASSTDTVYWYDAPSGGTLLYVGDSYFIPSLGVTTTYYIQTGMVCNNQDRVAVNATINTLPSVSLGNDTVVSDSIVLDAGAGFAGYNWSTGETTQTITVNVSGPYSLCVTDNNGCTNCDTINVNIIVGIENLGGNVALNVFPNPVHTNLNIEFPAIKGEVSMQLVDIRGQVMWRKDGSNFISESINVAGFAAGIYLLNVTTETGKGVYKIMIE